MDKELLQRCSGGASSKPTFAVVFSTLIALTASFVYGCAAAYSSPAQFGIMNDLGLSTAEYSLFGSLLTLGSMLGAIISGKVADFIGCKGATWFLQLFYVIGWLAIAFAKGIIPCTIQVIGLLFVPESPRWLVKVGRKAEFKATLQWLRGKEADITREAAEIENSTGSFEKQLRSGLAELLERRYVRPLMIGIGLSLFFPWGGFNAILFYATQFLKQLLIDSLSLNESSSNITSFFDFLQFV